MGFSSPKMASQDGSGAFPICAQGTQRDGANSFVQYLYKGEGDRITIPTSPALNWHKSKLKLF